ncbi:MAG: hypothetical protein EHM61_09700 [Acidobacteria bacterium]|nr:MAG: hypothetical protein EHM61_09700 [Acidobacteriota bacterium]
MEPLASLLSASFSSAWSPAPAVTSLALNNERIVMEVDWVTPDGSSGQAGAVGLTNDSGYFWFFVPTNVELVVKALDGRGTNGHFWVFFGALTDVQYRIKATDTQTGAVRYYYGQQGQQKSGYDLYAFE